MITRFDTVHERDRQELGRTARRASDEQTSRGIVTSAAQQRDAKSWHSNPSLSDIGIV